MAFVVRGGLASLSRKLLQGKPVEIVAVRCISGKTSNPNIQKRPPPYDYNYKRYTPLVQLVDKTTSRFNENSKVIVVEGPVACGKTKVAKALAEEFDMLYFPEANQDMIHINSYGFDLRKLDPQLPERVRSFDVVNFLQNPKHSSTLNFQLEQYRLKFSQYIDALAHLLSTGQGVVLDRSVYSDFVFAEAMYKCGYITKRGLNLYYEHRNNSLHELMIPQLVVYLDVPVNKTLENIKKRNNSIEVKSPVINNNFLSTMEEKYKQGFLKDMSKYAELLIYDWSDPGDLEVIIEDIERIDFNAFADDDPKWVDWDIQLEEDWAEKRRIYADYKDRLMSLVNNIPSFDLPETYLTVEEVDAADKIINSAPGQQFEKGYNASMGDQGILFKSGYERDTLPRRERQF